MKNLLVIVLVLFTTLIFAQNKRTLSLNEETDLIDVVYYHDNGVISQTGSYTADGKLEGNWFSYNREGAIMVTAFYKKGKKVGTWILVINDVAKEVDYTRNTASL